MSDLREAFGKSSAEIKGKELEALRHNYFIAAKMGGSDDASVGGLAINQSGRSQSELISKKKKQEDTISDLLLLEDSMTAKYGEDFAEQFGAQLLDEETFNELMKIEDQQERREAIAQAILDGIEDGSIDPADAYKNPDFKEWLDSHTAKRNDVGMNAKSDLESSHENDTNNNLAGGLDNIFGSPT